MGFSLPSVLQVGAQSLPRFLGMKGKELNILYLCGGLYAFFCLFDLELGPTDWS